MEFMGSHVVGRLSSLQVKMNYEKQMIKEVGFAAILVEEL